MKSIDFKIKFLILLLFRTLNCLGMKSGKIGKNMTIWNEIAHVIGIESDFGIALSGNGIYCVYGIYCGNGMNTAQN